MSDFDREETVVESAPNSILASLREKRAKAATNKTVDIAIPGYRGDLVARYHLLDPLVEGKVIGERMKREFPDDEDKMTYYALVDTLIAACDGLYLRNTEGVLEAIDPEGDGDACCYDSRLAAGLGIESDSARKTLLAVFNGNKVAVTQHSMRLQQWMADPSKNLSLGEA